MNGQSTLPLEVPTVSSAFGSKGAIIDPTGVYRYWLSRTWGTGPPLLWIMLNPSIADADIDDPTIRRVMAFSKREGFGRCEVVNLFGLRATHPAAIWGHPDPVGPDNDTWLHNSVWKAGKVIVAWGADGGGFGVVKDSETRDHVVCRWLRASGVTPYCLGTTAKGHPRHPLYVRGDAPLVPFILREEKGTARW